MIITKTPYRVSLFGGGSDHPAWFNKNGGEVISFAIDKYCYISVRKLPPFFEHRFRIVYSQVENTKFFDQITHPVVREAIRKFAPNSSLEIHYDGDLPARSGVGSSSAFAVGLIHALLLLTETKVSPYILAEEAIKLETEDLKENVGYQDQIACALGGFNNIKFSRNFKWEVDPIILDPEFRKDLTSRMVLIYSGITRKSSDIQKGLLENLNSKSSPINRVIELSKQCKKILTTKGDLDSIGYMLEESWNLKREMNPKSITPELDFFWDKAKSAGALGGKVLGAGGGGFCLFWIKAGRKYEFRKKFRLGLEIPMQISNSGTLCILK